MPEITETTFSEIEVGQGFVPYPGMPDRVFTRIKETNVTGWPLEYECGECGQSPIKDNATEWSDRPVTQKGASTQLYHHFCPQTRVWVQS